MIYKKKYDEGRTELTADGRLARKDKPEKTYVRVICLNRNIDNFIEVTPETKEEPKEEAL